MWPMRQVSWGISAKHECPAPEVCVLPRFGGRRSALPSRAPAGVAGRGGAGLSESRRGQGQGSELEPSKTPSKRNALTTIAQQRWNASALESSWSPVRSDRWTGGTSGNPNELGPDGSPRQLSMPFSRSPCPDTTSVQAMGQQEIDRELCVYLVDLLESEDWIRVQVIVTSSTFPLARGNINSFPVKIGQLTSSQKIGSWERPTTSAHLRTPRCAWLRWACWGTRGASSQRWPSRGHPGARDAKWAWGYSEGILQWANHLGFRVPPIACMASTHPHCAIKSDHAQQSTVNAQQIGLLANLRDDTSSPPRSCYAAPD